MSPALTVITASISRLPQRLLYWPGAHCANLPHGHDAEAHLPRPALPSLDPVCPFLFSDIIPHSDELPASRPPNSPPDNLQPHTAFPLPSPGTEVRLTALDKPTARGRSSGRILSTQDGVGLALLRIEQVESVWRGDGKMTVSFGVEEEGKEGISGWEIRPFASRWWPVKAAEPSTVAAPPPPLPVGEGATTS